MIQDCMRRGDFIRRGQKINRGLAVGFECGPQSSLTTVKPLSKNLLQYLQGMDCWIQPKIRTPGHPGILAIGFYSPLTGIYTKYDQILFPTSLCGVLAFGSALPPPALLLLLLPPPPPTTCPHATCPHTTCSHTACPHTTCSHTTCSHTTSPHTTCPHTTCSHTTCHTHNLSRRHPPSLCVAGVGLGDIHLHFAWQAWHWWHWAGSGGVLGSQLTPWTPRLFVRQAWHSATSTCILRGRRGTWWHPSSLCVAGVALMALGWLWWRAWFPDDAVDAAALCVAGVALGDIDVHPAWQAWDLVTSTFVSDGRRGTSGTSRNGLVLVARLSTHTLSTHNLSQLVHTTCPRITCRHTFVAHANPSPSLFSFPHFPSHLYLSFASYWKQLACGVIRSFTFFKTWLDGCLSSSP